MSEAASMLERGLVERGVNPQLAGALLERLGEETVGETIRWFDAQQGRVGAGVLVAELRRGGRSAERRPSPVEDGQRDYEGSILERLAAKLPGLARHPAAIVAVIHLDHRHGRVDVGEHASQIRRMVTEFERRWGGEL